MWYKSGQQELFDFYLFCWKQLYSLTSCRSSQFYLYANITNHHHLPEGALQSKQCMTPLELFFLVIGFTWTTIAEREREIETNFSQKRNPFVHFPPEILSPPMRALCFLSPCIDSPFLLHHEESDPPEHLCTCVRPYFHFMSVVSAAVIAFMENAVTLDFFAPQPWVELQLQLEASLFQRLQCSQ